MSRVRKNKYWFSDDGQDGFGLVGTGEIFRFDAEDFPRIKDTTWYRCNQVNSSGGYIGNQRGICIHRYILSAPKGYEIDHINHDTLDNRKINLRICTHQQNQFNQPLQKNNRSGVTGVSFYPPRQKYRARIKFDQTDLHLGYFNDFISAVQARNEGMRCLFGSFGLYNDVPDAPEAIKSMVKEKCDRFIQ